MPDGAVIIAAITSCTNTSNPRNVIAAGLLARNANARGPDAQALGEVLPGAGLQGRAAVSGRSRLLPELEKLGFGIVAFACTTCNGMSGALDPKIQQEIIDRDLYATAVLSGNRNFDGRIHPYAKQAFLASPPLVVAYAIAGTIRFDIEKDVLGIDADGNPVTLKDIWPSDEEIDAIVAASVKPEQFRQVYEPMFNVQVETRREGQPAVRLAPDEHLHPPSALLGRRAGRRAHAAGHAAAGGAAGQHHHRPPVAVERHHAEQRRRRVPGEDGPAGRGLQFLRHPPRRPPDRPARHLRQPDNWCNEMVRGRRQGARRVRWPASSRKAR